MQGIIDRLINEYRQKDNFLNIKIDISEVCRMLLDSKYKSVYSSRFNNAQMNINKKYVRLDSDSRLIIDKNTILYVSNMKFRFSLDSLGPSIFIIDTGTSCLVAFIYFKAIKKNYILELEECIGCCTMCKHARYHEDAIDINDFNCELYTKD